MAVVHPARPAAGPAHAEPPPEPPPPAPAVEPARPGWGAVFKHDLPASLVVFLIALPLCLAIARATGMPPEAGIVTGIVGGVLVGLIGGSPLQVSGPAAGLVVILLEVVERHGPERLGVVVLLAGLLQAAAGVFRLGQWFRAVSPAVVLGMLAGIGVVIFAQQFHVLVDDTPAKSPLRNLVTIPVAVWHGVADSHEGHPEHQEAALIGLLTLAALLLWPLVARRRLRAVPAVLVAVLLATAVTAVTAALGWPIQRVTFEGLAAGVRPPEPTGLWGLLADGAVWLTAGTVALVASAETLLCAAAVDQMHRGPRTRYDRELTAQGVGNAVCGALGALPMTGVIVRSSANVRAGARTRWAAVFHGVWLLGFVLLAPGALRLIPTAALAALLVLTGVRLVEVHACLALLTNWEKQHAAAGGKLVLDWETLRARFRTARPRPRAEATVVAPPSDEKSRG